MVRRLTRCPVSAQLCVARKRASSAQGHAWLMPQNRHLFVVAVSLKTPKKDKRGGLTTDRPLLRPRTGFSPTNRNIPALYTSSEEHNTMDMYPIRLLSRHRQARSYNKLAENETRVVVLRLLRRRNKPFQFIIVDLKNVVRMVPEIPSLSGGRTDSRRQELLCVVLHGMR